MSDTRPWLNLNTLAEIAHDKYHQQLGLSHRFQDRSEELKRAWNLTVREIVEVLKKSL